MGQKIKFLSIFALVVSKYTLQKFELKQGIIGLLKRGIRLVEALL